jgi:glutaredoxin
MKEIVVISMKGCSYCDALKSYLMEHNISYTELDDSTEQGRSKMEKYEIQSFPTTFILKDRIIKDVIQGFSVEMNLKDHFEKF